MAGSKKGAPQSTHLKPIRDTNDPRYKALAAGRQARSDRAAERRKYDKMLRDLQVRSYGEAVNNIENGISPTAMEVAQSIINSLNLQLAQQKPGTKDYNKTMDLLIKANNQYASMTGEFAASKQSIDITVEQEEEMTPEEIQQALEAKMEEMKIIDNK